MPFTLAHPAAVFPLRRVKWLPVIPLIVGSMTPDLVDFLPQTLLDRLPMSHSKIGSVIVDLPFGLALVAFVVLLQAPLTAPLWEPHRSLIRAAIARFTQLRGGWLTAAPAVFIGTWTHLLWDSCTHRDRWVVRQFPILQRPLQPDGEHIWELFHLLQYASSVIGLTVIALWYAFELRRSGLHGTGHIWRKCLLGACVVASLTIGVSVLTLQPDYGMFSNYMMFSIVLQSAMGSFALLYLASGLTIATVKRSFPLSREAGEG